MPDSIPNDPSVVSIKLGVSMVESQGELRIDNVEMREMTAPDMTMEGKYQNPDGEPFGGDRVIERISAPLKRLHRLPSQRSQFRGSCCC